MIKSMMNNKENLNEISVFLEKFSKLNDDLSPHRGIYRPLVRFYCEGIGYFKIIEIQPDIRGGCLCWDGIDVILEKDE